MQIISIVFAGIALVACDTIQIPMDESDFGSDFQTDGTDAFDQGQIDDVATIFDTEKDTQTSTFYPASEQYTEEPSLRTELIGTWTNGAKNNELKETYSFEDDGTFRWSGPSWNGDFNVTGTNGTWDLEGRELRMTVYILKLNDAEVDTEFKSYPSIRTSAIAIVKNADKNLYFDVFERTSGTELNFNGEWVNKRGIQLNKNSQEKRISLSISNAFCDLNIQDRKKNDNRPVILDEVNVNMPIRTEADFAYSAATGNEDLTRLWRFPFEPKLLVGDDIVFGVKISRNLIAAFRDEKQLQSTKFERAPIIK